MDRPGTRGVIDPRTRVVSLDGIRVEAPYPGSVISCNRYKWKGGRYTKPEAVAWRDMLATQVRLTARERGIEDELRRAPVLWIWMECFFKSGVHPDPSNLWKVSLDAIAQGLGRDDKGFRESVAGVHVSRWVSPQLVFHVRPGVNQAWTVEGADRYLRQQADLQRQATREHEALAVTRLAELKRFTRRLEPWHDPSPSPGWDW